MLAGPFLLLYNASILLTVKNLFMLTPLVGILDKLEKVHAGVMLLQRHSENYCDPKLSPIKNSTFDSRKGSPRQYRILKPLNPITQYFPISKPLTLFQQESDKINSVIVQSFKHCVVKSSGGPYLAIRENFFCSNITSVPC